MLLLILLQIVNFGLGEIILWRSTWLHTKIMHIIQHCMLFEILLSTDIHIFFLCSTKETAFVTDNKDKKSKDILTWFQCKDMVLNKNYLDTSKQMITKKDTHEHSLAWRDVDHMQTTSCLVSTGVCFPCTVKQLRTPIYRHKTTVCVFSDRPLFSSQILLLNDVHCVTFTFNCLAI